MFMFGTICLLLLVQGNAQTSANSLASDYEALQDDILKFNNTEIKQLHTALSENNKFSKNAFLAIQGITVMYKPVLVKMNTDKDRIDMLGRGKWMFHEDKNYVKDYIVSHAGDDHKLKEIAETVAKKLDEFKRRCINMGNHYSVENNIANTFQLERDAAALKTITTILKVPVDRFGTVESIIMNLLS